jgi:serine/threonine-protein kinase
MSTVDPRVTTQPDDERASRGGRAQGSVVGQRFEILALLGAGGMGNVYRARDLELDEIVAVKVLRAEIASAPGAVERFRREVKLARKVTHPNVARVFDIGEQGGEKILTMELIEGESLGALLSREGRLPFSRVVEIATAICAGVGAAHDAGVVHRDLKPDNVLMAKDGRIVVTDFGIARAAQITGAGRTLSGLVGTPAYMAPEQVEEREVDARADIYALGAMLYEMLTGEYPWQGESPIAIAAARLIHPPPDPREKQPDLDSRLADLVVHCLARKPEDRPVSMARVAATLATITTSRNVSASAPVRAEVALASDDKRVAVLPFRNLGPAEHDYLADGLTDDLIDLLSVARGLRVHSRGAVSKFKTESRDVRQIGRELGVQVVVDGSIRKGPGSFRISARLISVADGIQLWARRFEGAEGDILALDDEVAKAVADALTVDLEKGEARPIDAAVVDLYLRARLQYLRNYFPDSKTATDLFGQALERAPDDPRIIAGYVMARARARLDDASRQALRAQAERAVRIAPSLPETHLALGAVLFQSLDEVGATRAFHRALSLNANCAEAHDFLGRILEETDGAEAKRHLEIAMALEPTLTLPRVSLVRYFALREDWNRVEEFLEAPSGMDAKALVPHRARLIMWRRDARAADELEPSLTTDEVPIRAARVMLRLASGRLAAGEPMFQLPAHAGPRLTCFYAQLDAEAHGLLDDRARALDAIERASRMNLYDVSWLERCPLLRSLRDEPRYRAVREVVAARAAAVRAAYLDSTTPAALL